MMSRARSCTLVPIVSVVMLFVVSFLAGCGSSPSVGSITIGFTSSAVAVGGTIQLHATDNSALHVTTDATTTATWSSSNPAILSVNSSGLVTGITTGYATIKAQLGQDSGGAVITVTGSTVTGLVLTPANATVYLGGGQQYSATATNSNGVSTDVTSTTTWSVAPTSVATISSSGVLTSVAAGSFTVTGTSGSQTATATGTVAAVALSSIAVTPANSTVTGGSTQQFKAIGTYNDGSSRDLTGQVTWASSDTTALTISASGLATVPSTAATGSVTVTATQGPVAGTASVQITSSATLTNLVVEPTSSSTATGSAQQNTATAWYSDGTQVDVTKSVTWSSTSSTVTSVNASGVSTAATPGTTTLTATLGVTKAIHNATAQGASASPQAGTSTMQSSSVVIVTPATVTALAIRATRDLFPIGATQPVQLIGTFSDGTSQDLSLTANWQSSDPTIATIDQTGLATGIKAGDVVFTASFGGLTASTIGFQVLPSTLIAATIAVDYPAQLSGIPEQLHFIGTYSDGSTHDLTELATFVSSDPTIFATSSSGLAYGVGSGSTQVTGTALGFKAIIQLASYKDPVTALKVFPSQARFALGTHLSFKAVVYAQDPATGEFFQDVTPPSVWTSSDPTVLTIDANGVAKSGKVGTTTVSATLLGVTTFSDTVTVTNAKLKRITLSRALDTVAVGTGQNYTANGFFSDGSVQDITQDVTWNTSDNTIASIDNAGLGLGMRAGQVQVTAALSGVTASTPLTVTNATLSSLALLPGDAELPINVYKQYALIGTFSDGSTQDLTYGAIFLSPTPGIVAVYPQGVATGTFPGIGQISAQFGYFTASTPVNVTGALPTGLTLTPSSATIRLGGSQQFVATGTFSDGYSQVLNGTVVFTSSAPLVAPATQFGLIYGTSLGTTTLTASIYGQTKTANITVLSNVLTSILLTPANPTVSSGSTLQLTATGVYADASTDDLTSAVNWTVSDPTLVTVNSSGLLTAVAGITSPVTVTVVATAPATANYPTITSSLVFTIKPSSSPIGNPIALQVTPPTVHLPAGSTKQLTATAAYADGTTGDVSSTVTWTSANPATAKVNAAGVVTAVASGTVSVQAQTQGVSGPVMSSSIVTVVSATVKSLAIAPGSANFAVGATQKFTLTATFSDGTSQDVSSGATWTSSNTQVATVDSTGVATGIAPGQVDITATYGGLTATSSGNHVTETTTLVNLVVRPTSSSIATGSAEQHTATAWYSDGSQKDVTNQVTWSSASSSVSSVNASGTNTAGTPGMTTIQASLPTNASSSLKRNTHAGAAAPAAAPTTIQSSSVVIVTPATVTSLAIRASKTQFPIGTTQPVQLIGTFSDGSYQDLSLTANWQSSNPATATIDNTGLATGVSAGNVVFSASFGGISVSTVGYQVLPANLVSTTINATYPTLISGTCQQLKLTGTYADGSTHDLSGLAMWTSADSTILTVDPSGYLCAVQFQNSQVTVKATQITATAFGNSSVLNLAEILDPGISVTVYPTVAKFALGTRLPLRSVELVQNGISLDLTVDAIWVAADPTVLTVDANGLAKSGKVGVTTVQATVLGVVGTSNQIEVTNATITKLVITRTTPKIAAGTGFPYKAIGFFSDGSTQNMTLDVNWNTSDNTIASIDTTGIGLGLKPGTVQITASFGGQTASVPLTVTNATLQSTSLSPNNTELPIGTKRNFALIGTFSDGTTQDLSYDALYSTPTPSILSFLGPGQAVGAGPGVGELTAQRGYFTSSTPVTVVLTYLQSMALTPASTTIRVAGGQLITATGTFQDGFSMNLVDNAVFTSSAPQIANVLTSGLTLGAGIGSAQISATFEGVTASTTSFNVLSGTITSVTLSPANPSVTAGSTQQLTATATYADGTTGDVTSDVTWTSSNPATATISASGVISALAAGTTTITGQLDGQSFTTTVVVTARTVASLAVTPTTLTLTAGSTQQYTATATYTDGTTANVSAQATWTSSNTSVATINATGLATITAAGSATITAQFGGKSSTSTLTVTGGTLPTLQSITITPAASSIAKGNTQQFIAAGLYSDGTTKNITTQVSWLSSVPAVATISNAGLATSLLGGNTQISASLSGQSTVATLTVSPATLASIAVTPQTASVASGTTQQYKATGTLSDGSTQDLTTSVTWSSSNTSLATVNASGLATTSGTGTATITATAGATGNSATLTITTAAVTGLQVTPSPLSLPAGGTQQLLVTATFSDGSSQNVTSAATYTTTNSSVVSVDASGKLHAVGPGTATVTITLNGSTTTLTVTITNATVTSIAITPQTPTLAAGQSQQLTATATYTDGSTENLTSTVTWTTSNSNVATVSPTGNVIVAQSGTAIITATYSGISATDTVTGTASVPTAISVSPASVNLAAGQTQQFSATATMSDGTQQTLTTSVHWSVSDPTKASVSNSSGSNGLFTANAAGTVNVVAALNGVSGSATVTISAATLSSLTINPSAIISLPAGTNEQLSVTGAYSDGSSANVTSQVTWSSSQASTAYVDSSALLHAVSSGTTTIDAVLQGVTGTSVVTVGNATLTSIAITPATPVLALGQTVQLTATGTYSNGSTANITSQVQWNSGTPVVATISSTGLVSTLTTGSSSLSATLNGVSQSTPLTVTTATLQSISVQSTASSFALGTSLQLKAMGIYSDGSTQDLTNSVTWSSSAPTVGIVSSTGVATGVTTGTFNAKATSNGVTGSLPLTVSNATLVSIAVTPNGQVIVDIQGTTVQFTATGTFSDGSTQNLTNSVHWTTTGIVVGTISNTGVFSPTGVGLGTVVATSGTISGSAQLTVVSVPLL